MTDQQIDLRVARWRETNLEHYLNGHWGIGLRAYEEWQRQNRLDDIWAAKQRRMRDEAVEH